MALTHLRLQQYQRDLWADAYYQQTQQMLAPLATSGVRIFLFNFGILQQNVAVNPAHLRVYQRHQLRGGAGLGDHARQRQREFARLFLRKLGPPDRRSHGVDREIHGEPDRRADHRGAARRHHHRHRQRFRRFRVRPARRLPEFPAVGARAVNPEDQWSVFSNVTYSNGGRDRRFLRLELRLQLRRRHVRNDYRVDQNWRLGGVFGYAQPEVKLGVQNAIDHRRLQFAGYGSYTDAHLFFDGLVAYGHQNYAIERDGIIDAIRAKPTPTSSPPPHTAVTCSKWDRSGSAPSRV